jgi:coproporphyrinogen III oxidase
LRCAAARHSTATRQAVPAAAALHAPAQLTAQPVDAAAFEAFLLAAQKQILAEAEQLDGSGRAFVQDRWERPGDNAGYGITCVLEGGALLEKAAANISVVRGTLTPARAQVRGWLGFGWRGARKRVPRGTPPRAGRRAARRAAVCPALRPSMAHPHPPPPARPHTHLHRP